MIRTGAFRRQEQEDEVDRLVVQRLEVNGRLEPREEAGDLRKLLQLAVRDGDAIAHAGGAEPLALKDDVDDLTLRNSGDLCRSCCQLLKQLLLGIALHRWNNRTLLQQTCQCHALVLVRWGKGLKIRGAGLRHRVTVTRLLILAASIQPI